ncbi:hypothetical protein N7486_007825 [Penicillium sp. IBT 16267x]|nr:hypothetical protein N7486_007825 [Penicillium sp. IBT 16267x]
MLALGCSFEQNVDNFTQGQPVVFLMSSGITAGLDAALAFMAATYVAPENREMQGQEISLAGEKTVIPGFEHGKAFEYARSISWRLEYEWHEDPSNDPFV